MTGAPDPMDALKRPYGGAPAPKDDRGSLPKGLWIGTAVFAVLSAVVLWFGLRMGQDTLENSSKERLESAAVRSELAEKEKPAPDAREHYDRGLRAFKAGDLAKAREEWLLCKGLEPENGDCLAGLQRIESAQAAAPAAEPDDSGREAAKHWNLGLMSFQRGDYQKARDEWRLCAALNADCATGLQRIERAYGR